ncbi:aldo/keto reductase [Marispirochaeta aestuarii]|uniref:aldo/keto reductase n=1 Tax=Marispirochaeta aestuarii TaxID=1963862 RepID=UPI0029C7153E|nr:aldo/keto reductase [Marispirochaeta aestuarii]
MECSNLKDCLPGHPFCLGTVQFGSEYGVSNREGRTPVHEAKKIIEYGYSQGMRTLDTAALYGNSECVLGEIGVDNWDVITKLPEVPDDCDDIEQWVKKSVHNSLYRLKKKSIYGLLLHRPDQLLHDQGKRLKQALLGVKNMGLVLHLGVSVYSEEQLKTLLDVFPVEIVQLPLNVIDQRFVQSGMINIMKKEGIEIHARSIFLQGVLLMKPSLRPVYFSRWKIVFDKWDNYLKKNGISALDACIKFALSVPGIHKVLVGVQNHMQLEEILEKEIIESGNIDLPEGISSNDQELINPSLWRLT